MGAGRADGAGDTADASRAPLAGDTPGSARPPLSRLGDWRAYLESLAAFGMRPGLERVTALLGRLGRPQDGLRVIHVVGTNGKSSTTRYCEALLRAHGLRAGAYLSPHLSDWTERVLVGGRPVKAEEFGGCVERVRAEALRLGPTLGDATQFEVLTVAALLALAENGTEAAAIEAGLGGRLDATNVVQAPVVALTNVALDHTEWLGETRSGIFAEKAAVIQGGDAVFGPLDGLEEQARRVCSRAGARAYLLDQDFAIEGSPRHFAVTATAGREAPRPGWAEAPPLYEGLAVQTPALYQIVNAGLAVVAVHLLLGGLDEPAVRRALRGTTAPGRLQRVAERPLVLVDGAHNPHAVRELARSLREMAVPRPLVGVLAIMRDKRYGEMLEDLLPLFDSVFLTQSSEPRSLAVEDLRAAVSAAQDKRSLRVPVVIERDPHRALEAARRVGADGSVLVTGSLYLLEDLMDVFGEAG
jgi:dihydrofolate synthase / folylpolyglutamate synthase